MDEIRNKYSVPEQGFMDYKTVKTGETLNLGGVDIKILNSYGDADDGIDENGNSISFKLSYKGFTLNYGGDIYGYNQLKILERFPDDVKADVCFTNHHLHGSVDPGYMIKVDPYLFITSAQEAVYARGAYATVFKDDVVNYLKTHNGRLLDDLLTLESGSVVIRVISGNNWSYEEYLKVSDIPVEGLKF
jgi:hypothetical protein